MPLGTAYRDRPPKLIITGLLLLVATAAWATTYTVAPDGSGDFPTIQAAIDAALSGDRIELIDGTFLGPGNRAIDFGGKAITLAGQSGDPATCLIDCENQARAFDFHSGEDTGALLSDIAITRGQAAYGGAIRCSSAAPRLIGCLYFENIADSSGGALEIIAASPQIIGCTFVLNSAPDSSGAIAVRQGAPSLENCIIAFTQTGRAVRIAAGGNATLSCCDLYGNAGGNWTGALGTQLGINGNIELDPLFCDQALGDFTLHADSPCAPLYNLECGLLGALPIACGPQTHTVRPEGLGDFPTIQAALDAAVDGGTIELTAGTFTGPGNRDLVFLGKAVTLRPRGDDEVILDCEGSPEDPHRAISFAMLESNTTVVERLTIRNAYCLASGGAIICYASSPTIVACHFESNGTDFRGGAIYAASDADPRITDCTFTNNLAGTGGGALAFLWASPLLEGCTLFGNTAPEGSGIYCHETGPTLWNTLIAGGLDGAAMAFEGPCAPYLNCCAIFGNEGGDWVGILAAQLGSEGNIWEDPLFCDADNGDLRLDSASPCAAPPCGQIGAHGIGCETETYYINAAGTGDFPTIQAAINAAFNGATIMLASGIYAGEGNRDLVYYGKAITVRSETGNAEDCVIDAGGSAGEYHRGAYFYYGEGPEAVLEGVTITGGYEPSGGGVFCNMESSPTIRNCILRDNEAPHAGGGLHVTDSSPTVIGCTISGNWSDYGGGMICFYGSAPSFTDCVISGNWAISRGGGISTSGCSPTFLRCAISGNWSEGPAGGVFTTDDSATFTECTFTGNWAATVGGAFHSRYAPAPTLTDCTFFENEAATGSGLYCESSQPIVENTIVAFGLGGGGVICDGDAPFLTCCDIFGNAGGDWTGVIAPLLGLDGNISADPLFCGESLPSAPLSLTNESPCAPEQQPVCGLIGAHPVGCQGQGIGEMPRRTDALMLTCAGPNPFGRETIFHFSLPHAAVDLRLGIFDLNGRLARRLLSGPHPPGRFKLTWNGTNAAGERLPNGIYFCRLEQDDQMLARRIVLMRAAP